MPETPRRRRRPVFDTQRVLAMAGAIGIALVGIAAFDLGGPGSSGYLRRAVLAIDPLAGRPGGPFTPEPAPVPPGRLCIAGLPAGALLRVDGRAVPLAGEARAELEVPPGAHRVEVRAADGAAWATRLSVGAGGQASVQPDLSGEVAFEAEPGASVGVVFFDGAAIGCPPAVLDSVPAGPHRVTLFSNGSVQWEREIAVRAGALTRVVVPGIAGGRPATKHLETPPPADPQTPILPE